MTELVVQADLGGLSIAFTEQVEGKEGIDATLDIWAKAIGRQRARVSLGEKLVDFLAARNALKSLPEREQEALKLRASERARAMASLHAAHDVRGKRGEFKMTAAQRQKLDDFDAETQSIAEKFSNEKQGLLLQLPIFEAQIKRLQDRLAGREASEALEDEMALGQDNAPMAEAAE